MIAPAAAVFGGHDYVEETTGLTYADYVHQGFGQLTLATVLTLFVIWAASRRAGRAAEDRWWLRGSLGLLCLMTLVVVWSALYRMHVYQEAYGWTGTRVLAVLVELWLGVVVLAVLASLVVGRRWLGRTIVLAGAVVVLLYTVGNTSAFVVERNVARYEATGKLDIGYLSSLGGDAAPESGEDIGQLAAWREPVRFYQYYAPASPYPEVFVDTADTVDVAAEVLAFYQAFYKWAWTPEQFRAARTQVGRLCGASDAERFTLRASHLKARDYLD